MSGFPARAVGRKGGVVEVTVDLTRETLDGASVAEDVALPGGGLAVKVYLCTDFGASVTLYLTPEQADFVGEQLRARNE